MREFPRDIRVILTCKTLPAIGEPAYIGIQGKDQNVLIGIRRRDGSFEFQCVIQVRDKEGGNIDFAGPFVHGSPASRFLYLSWKRTVSGAAPWIQRVKIPLVFKATDLEAATTIRADITDRRPRTSRPIVWTITTR